jgi:putative acetyltransferase
MINIQYIKEEGPLLDIVRTLFRQYQEELNEDLCFQSFDQELSNPLMKYGPPAGLLLLAYYNNEVAGCIALTPMKEESVCEMKRLYVLPAYRKFGVGRQLVEALLTEAKAKGYRMMKLDTLQKLQAAITMYERYGFTPTNPYNVSPLAGMVYMEKTLII